MIYYNTFQKRWLVFSYLFVQFIYNVQLRILFVITLKLKKYLNKYHVDNGCPNTTAWIYNTKK